MPIAASLDAGNRAQTARLRALVAGLDASALAVRLPNAWTVAVALARLDKPNLDRGSHREYHLDQVEQSLAARGGR